MTGMIAGEELCSLLPHRGKMVFLSRVLAWDTRERTLSAEYEAGPDCLFYDPALGGIPSWVSVECMAQGISALSGIAGREEGRKPKPGFILSVSALELSVPLLRPGVILIIRVRENSRVDAVFNYDCQVSARGPGGSSPVGKAKLTVMEADDISRWERRGDLEGIT
jgi:predicted hotdog family 3-hydroxylacyl-ACP dehydratase